MRTIKLLLAAGFLLVLGTSAYAQVQRNETYLPKFAIKTNALYWATSTPNLGFEVGLAKKITLDVSGNYNPWKFGNDRQIKHWLVQPELRYWLCERSVRSRHLLRIPVDYQQTLEHGSNRRSRLRPSEI